MAKKWIYTGAFSYAGEHYITWIRPTFMNEDHSWSWEHRTEKASAVDISKAEKENDRYFTGFSSLSK